MRFQFSKLSTELLLATTLALPLGAFADRSDAGLLIQPYVQRQGQTAITILFETTASEEITLNYRKTTAENWKIVTEDEADTEHRFRLSNLHKNRTYEYYLTDDDGDRLTVNYTFKTARNIKEDKPLKVAVVGDSGNNSVAQYEVASEIVDWQPDLFLHTGDIAYESGTKTEFVNNVFDVYSTLFARVPFYPSMGNHDYTTENGGPYKDLFETPTSSGSEDYYTFSYDTARFVVLNTNIAYDSTSEQYQWLEETLGAATEPWVIVYFHHPVYSSGSHGSTAGLADALVPLFEEYGVDLVMNGHDHHYERFEKEAGVTYIVTGGGGRELYELGDTLLDNSAYAESVFHFVGLNIFDHKIKIQAISRDGYVIDSVTLTQ